MYREMLKGEEARRGDHDVDIMVIINLLIVN